MPRRTRQRFANGGTAIRTPTWEIATGGPSGLVVLDIDPRHGGLESLKKLERMIGRLPDGPRVRTGGGGLHFYFRHPGGSVKSRTGILPGIDVRADGTYVVGPGSAHETGRTYLWLHDKTPEKVALPTLPEGLLRLVQGQSPSISQPTPVIPEGLRNSTLASLAGAMRSRGMTGEAITAALLQENLLRCAPPLSDTEVMGIARSISNYPVSRGDLLSASSKNEEAAERILKFRTGAELAEETSAEVPWISRPWVALEAITELNGKVKLAGKTTYVTHMVKSVLEGLPFLGAPTKKTKVVFLTEQPPVSFRAALERAGLLGRRDLIVLFWGDTIGMSWHAVAQRVVQECKRRHAKFLIVDTLGQFAGLSGDSENFAGDALRALQPLQQAAAEGIGVLIVRHERKSGGALGDSGRGSSAFAGAVDIIVSLRRPEGNKPRNVRLLQSVSRFGNADDLLVELTDEGYRPLGTPGEAAKAQAAADLLSAIPKGPKKAATIDDLVKTTNRSRAQAQKLLEALVETDEVLKSGDGHRGSPYRYFRA
jgi:Bifunctional DNA primase/polymerase, N-terminal/AAA domain/Primase C terminal 1 (PriCT-1)